MSSHNQYQYQEAAKLQGLKLNKCTCGPLSFPIVEYYPNKGVRITCRKCANKVIVKPNESIKTDREMVIESATRWNKRDFDR